MFCWFENPSESQFKMQREQLLLWRCGTRGRASDLAIGKTRPWNTKEYKLVFQLFCPNTFATRQPIAVNGLYLLLLVHYPYSENTKDSIDKNAPCLLARPSHPTRTSLTPAQDAQCCVRSSKHISLLTGIWTGYHPTANAPLLKSSFVQEQGDALQTWEL